MTYVWHNGSIKPAEEAGVSPFDRGLLYGDGLFETIRAVDGKPEFLEEHLARLSASARALAIPMPPLPWEEIIGELLVKNGLTRGTARVKILLTRGTTPGVGLPAGGDPTCIVTAVRYAPARLPERVGVYPVRRAAPTAAHKTLNFLFNLQAREWALRNGYDEAVLLGMEGEILECSTSNIFFRRGREIIKPRNEGLYLEGIMGRRFLEMKRKEGFAVRERKIFPAEIDADTETYITNSLIGIRRVEMVREGTGGGAQDISCTSES